MPSKKPKESPQRIMVHPVSAQPLPFALFCPKCAAAVLHLDENQRCLWCGSDGLRPATQEEVAAALATFEHM